MKHTPGPWRIGDKGMTVFGPLTDQPSPIAIANLIPPTPRAGIEEREANAHLIAAAPDLLAASEQAAALLKELAHDGAENPELEILRKAIAKAKGES